MAANAQGHRYRAENAYSCNDAEVAIMLETAFATLLHPKAFALYSAMNPCSRRPLPEMALSMHKQILAASVMVALAAFASAWLTKARFLGFAAYIAIGGGGSTREVVLTCKAYLDSQSPLPFEVRLGCLCGSVGLLFQSVPAFVGGGYAEEVVCQAFSRYVGRND